MCIVGKVGWLPAQRAPDTVAHAGVTTIENGV
jgi:hypothetical protein